MTYINLNTAKNWPDYRAVWRWHFYASLFCMPFVIFLSITGAIYLFKPQFENWKDREYDNLAMSGERANVSEMVLAALRANSGAIPYAYELPTSATSASRVLITKDGKVSRVFVHPQTLAVMGIRQEDEGLIKFVKSLHGQLNLGPRGSYIVELAACWTMVMILTGLYLWWPRSAKGLGGILYPRFGKGTKLFLRDIHSVTGIWISVMAIFLIASGLPWAKFWGSYYKSIKAAMGTPSVQQDWTTGGIASADGHHSHEKSVATSKAGSGARRQRTITKMPQDLNDFNRVVAAVEPFNLAYPATVSPPDSDSNKWIVKSESQNRMLRTTIIVDGTSGKVLSRESFMDRPLIDRIVSIGISIHEAQLFGIVNQLLGLLTAMGLILLSVSGYVMWWRRREPGKLGAPRAITSPSGSIGLIVIVTILAVYMPLFGISLVAVFLIERVFLARVASIKDWLGLNTERAVAAPIR